MTALDARVLPCMTGVARGAEAISIPWPKIRYLVFAAHTTVGPATGDKKARDACDRQRPRPTLLDKIQRDVVARQPVAECIVAVDLEQ